MDSNNLWDLNKQASVMFDNMDPLKKMKMMQEMIKGQSVGMPPMGLPQMTPKSSNVFENGNGNVGGSDKKKKAKKEKNNMKEIPRNDSLDKIKRVPTGYSQLDKLFGGGLALGGTWYAANGQKSTGKSTLYRSVLYQLAKDHNIPSLICSSEMTWKEVKREFELKNGSIDDLPITILSSGMTVNAVIKKALDVEAKIVLVDSMDMFGGKLGNNNTNFSIQRIYHIDDKLREKLKENDITLISIFQSTKDNKMAGSNKLSHGYDVVLKHSRGKSTDHITVTYDKKNRLGSIHHQAEYTLDERGMVERSPLINGFTQDHGGKERIGCIATAHYDSTNYKVHPTRIQASIKREVVEKEPSKLTIKVQGMNQARIDGLVAALELEQPVDSKVTISVLIRNIKQLPEETEAAVAVAIYSSYYKIPLPQSVAVLGALGPDGLIERIDGMTDINRSLKDWGYTKVYGPEDFVKETLDWTQVNYIQELFRRFKKRMRKKKKVLPANKSA